MKKRLIATTLLATMVVSALAGCSKSEGTSGKSDVPTLKWVTVGSKMPDNYASWQQKVNEYISPKIGANLDIEVISWGDWDARRNTIVTANEPFDIIFGNQATFPKDVKLGALADITEYIKEDSPLKELIPADYWRATTVNGKIYGIPTYKDSSLTQYFVWDKEILDKYEVTDYENINSLEAAEPILKKITEGENKASFPLYKRGIYPVLDNYDSFGLGLPFLGVKFDDKDGKVVNKLVQDDIMSELKALHRMYEAGVVNPDAFTTDEIKPQGVICNIQQGWPLAAQTVWGPQRGVECVVSRYTPTLLNNDSVLGSVNSISANSKYIKEAVALLELVNSDSKLRDMLYYGEEGVDFEYQDNKIKRLKEDYWAMAGYTQGTFFNVTQLVDTEVNQWDEVKALNAEAIPSVLLGFQFDNTSVESEIANLSQVWESSSAELMTGAKEPEAAVAELNEKLEAAGMQKVIDECQKQIDTYLASKK